MTESTPATPTPIPGSLNVPARIASEAHRYELTLNDYWRIFLKRRMVVFFTFVSVLASAIVYTNSQTPMYQAASAVRISTGSRAFQFQDGMYVPRFGDALSTYANMIVGKEVLERVVIRLGLLSPDSTARELADKTADIRGAISTSQVGVTDIIRIVVNYPDPDLAAAIANQTAETFVEVDLLEQSRQARNLRRFIENQLALFEKKLRQTEDSLRQFRQSGRALGIAVGLDQRLTDLEKERNAMLKQFTEKHPDVVKLDSLILSLRERIKKMPADELELARLQRELEINDRGYRTMKDKYESARLAEAEHVSDITIVESATVPRSPISPKKAMNKLLGAVVGLLLGVIFAFINETLDTSIGTIEDVERTVRLPVIGIVPYHNPRHQDLPWWRFDVHMMSFFQSRRDLPPDATYLIMNQDTFSTLSEAYRILRTFVEFIMDRKDRDGRVIVITSTGPQEGKTLTSCNLAISLAQAGRKTILIDADMRRPTVHRLFGLKRSPGLSDILLGTTTLADGRKTMGDILVGETSQWDHILATKMLDRLEIVTSGTHTHTPAELLASDGMRTLLEQARIQYDYIIIDTPPVLPVTDARALGVISDATFFVYRAGKTARRALTRAREELNLAGVKVKGIILNHATPEVTLTDSYYYEYYGEKSDKKNSKKEKSKPAPVDEMPKAKENS